MDLLEGGLFLPPSLAKKKREIERSCEEFFEGEGFKPIDLPALENVPGSEDDSDRYKFLTPDGNLVTLRYDYTDSLIRTVANRDGFDFPCKLYYSGVVYRKKMDTAGFGEIAQVGAEVLGDDSVEMDANIIRWLVQLLNAIDLKDFLVDIGTVEVYKGIVKGIELSNDDMTAIREAILKKDEKSLSKTLENVNLPDSKKKILMSLPGLYGKADVFDRAFSVVESDRSRKGLEQLQSVYKTLVDAGLGDKISVDLGMVQSLDYYTGPVFEAYVRNVGEPVASGGRYDRLGEQYGKKFAATGFALNIGLLLNNV